MSTIKNDDIIGYRIDGRDLCLDCVSEEDIKNAGPDQMITAADLEKSDSRCFCDECKKEIE